MVMRSRLRRDVYLRCNSKLSVEVVERMTEVRDVGKCTMSPTFISLKVALIGAFSE